MEKVKKDEKNENEEKFYDAKYDTVFKNTIACDRGLHILKAIIENAI